jgi:hypothetical protein
MRTATSRTHATKAGPDVSLRTIRKGGRLCVRAAWRRARSRARSGRKHLRRSPGAAREGAFFRAQSWSLAAEAA